MTHLPRIQGEGGSPEDLGNKDDPYKGKIMNIEFARENYEEIKQTKLESLYQDLLKAAIRYAHIRAEWSQQDHEKKLQINAERSRAHNVLIDCCNILARNQNNAGEPNSWRDKLGADRKVICDFACYLHLFAGLESR